MVAEIGTLVGQTEVEQIERAMTARDEAREKLAIERYRILTKSIDSLTRHIGHQNGSIGDLETEVGDIQASIARIDGEKTGKAMASSLFWKLVGTGIALVTAAAAVGAIAVGLSQ